MADGNVACLLSYFSLGWGDLHNEFLKQKNAVTKHRQLELAARAEAVRDMYHQVVESVLDLYKGSFSATHMHWPQTAMTCGLGRILEMLQTS